MPVLKAFLLAFVSLLSLVSSEVGSSVCSLDKNRIVKNLATKTPYAFLLDDITPNSQLNVSLSPYLNNRLIAHNGVDFILVS
jgi:hypothetical protein